MRMKLIAMSFVAVVLSVLMPPASTSALGLKVAPLEYKTTLKKDEVQQGFIDISNPAAQAVDVKVTVQAFRQINNDGGLTFYDDALLSSGIKPEITAFELGPREAYRIFFTVDGKVLPQGDVYAAIFFTTEPKQRTNGVGQLVKVGSILSIVNNTPGERKAEITGISLPFIQLGSSASGSYKIKNTGKQGKGFYPDVSLNAWPGSAAKKQTSTLVFGGVERSNEFTLATGYGIYKVQAAYGDSTKSQWVIVIAPWMLLLTLLVIIVIGVELLLLKKRRKSRPKQHPKSHTSTPEK